MDEYNKNNEPQTEDNAKQNLKDFKSEENLENTVETVEVTEQPDPAPAFNWRREALDWVVSIAVAIVIALVIKTYVFTLVRVDGPSMNPTLTNGDVLYANRFMYKPAVGDIIIFRPPNSPKTPYIKRVIAVGGQTVEVNGENHTVTVDGVVLDEKYIAEPLESSGTMEYPCTVPEGYILVMGDNRNNSRDSRDATVGLIPLGNVIGKAEFRLLPFSDFGSLYAK